MTYRPGIMVFLGSGETAPHVRKVYDWLFDYLDEEIHTAILETPAGFEPNSAHVAQQISDYFQKHLQNYKPDISVIPARKKGTEFSPNNPDLLTDMLTANVLFTGPGSPTYAARQLMDSIAWQTLLARHRTGASLIFASASTIAASAYALPVYEIYKVGEDLHWKEGLNFFGGFGLPVTIIPHWNNNDGGDALDTSRCYVGEDRYNQLVDMLPDPQIILGIDENTALVVDPAEEMCHVMGIATLRIIRPDGEEKIFESGESFPMSEFGDYHMPEPHEGIPDDVWERVEQALEEAQQAAEPTQEAMRLLRARDEARNNKEWDRADALRDELEVMGWKVVDTREGSMLEAA